MIRAATDADAPGIAALWNWMIRDTLATFTPVEKSVDEIRGLVAAQPAGFFVATGRSGITGFATFGSFRSGPGYAATVEHSVIIAPKAQGSGVGRALMARLEQAAGEQGVRVMVAAISGANESATVFHTRLGFVQVGRLPQVGYKNGQWLDLILMQKNLTADG